MIGDWDEYVPRVYQFAHRLSGNSHDAEDITQETFLRALRGRSSLRNPGTARVWLFRIAANIWRDWTRRRRHVVARAGPLSDQRSEPAMTERTLVAQEDLTRAMTAMKELSARQQQVVFLIVCESLSVAQAAEILNCTTDAVKMNLSLARRKLRTALRDLYEELFPGGQGRR